MSEFDLEKKIMDSLYEVQSKIDPERQSRCDCRNIEFFRHDK